MSTNRMGVVATAAAARVTGAGAAFAAPAVAGPHRVTAVSTDSRAASGVERRGTMRTPRVTVRCHRPSFGCCSAFGGGSVGTGTEKLKTVTFSLPAGNVRGPPGGSVALLYGVQTSRRRDAQRNRAAIIAAATEVL